MKNLRRRVVPLLALLVLLCGVMTVNAFAADDPTEEIGTKMIECPDCGAVGVVLTDEGTAAACESCGGTRRRLRKSSDSIASDWFASTI